MLEDDGDTELIPAVPAATMDAGFPPESVMETPDGAGGSGMESTLGGGKGEEEEAMASGAPRMEDVTVMMGARDCKP